MKGWKELKIKNICEIRGGKRLPKGEDFSANGYPYIRARDIKNGKITFNDPVYISERVRNQIKRYTVNKNDICITIVGINIGDVGIVPAYLHNANLTENAAKLINLKNVYHKYLIYYLQLKNVRDLMQIVASGVAQGKLGLYKIQELPVILPPLPIQKKIAAILSAYDELIENNNRRIAILEKMAEEIYREWFVSMRFPGHEKVKIVKGVPEGWEVKKLGEFCKRVTDGTHDTPKPISEGYYLITGKNIKNGLIDFSNAYKISEKDHINISKRSGLKEGDILFSNIGTIGSLSLVTGKIDYSVKNVIIFKPKNINQSLFLYYLLKEKYILEQFLSFSSGASQQFISLGVARNYKILVPKEELIKKFGNSILNIYLIKQKLLNSNNTLKKTLDLLLPRLISGKLDVEKLDITFPPGMEEESA